MLENNTITKKAVVQLAYDEDGNVPIMNVKYDGYDVMFIEATIFEEWEDEDGNTYEGLNDPLNWFQCLSTECHDGRTVHKIAIDSTMFDKDHDWSGMFANMM